MIKKTITALLITILFCSILIPSTITVNAKPSMASVVDIKLTNVNESLPIKPLEESRPIEIDIIYSITKGIAFRNIFYPFLLKGKQIDITFELVDQPDWCKFTILDDTVSLGLPNSTKETKEFTKKFFVTLGLTAPAYKVGQVEINVSVPPIKGPLGIITFIDGYKSTFTIPLRADYVGLIAAEFPQGDSIEISPYNETIIPIDIANLGNGETKVFFEIVNASDSFNITLDSDVIIDVDGKATTNLILKADHNFKLEDITLKLTPVFSDNIDIVGESSEITISVENDGSYVEEEGGFVFDATLLIVVLVIIILLAVAYKLLKRK